MLASQDPVGVDEEDDVVSDYGNLSLTPFAPQDDRKSSPAPVSPPQPYSDGDDGEDALFDNTQSSTKYTPQHVDASVLRDLPDDDDVDASTSKQFYVSFNKDLAPEQASGFHDGSTREDGVEDIGVAQQGLHGTVMHDNIPDDGLAKQDDLCADIPAEETQKGTANVHADDEPSQEQGKTHMHQT